MSEARAMSDCGSLAVGSDITLIPPPRGQNENGRVGRELVHMDGGKVRLAVRG